MENPKRSVMIKGPKSNNELDNMIRDLHLIRGGDSFSKLFLRSTHDIRPFEEEGGLERFSDKNDCSLFVVGTHQKKRPNNLIMGRMYCSHLLDMFEFGVENF